MKDSHQDDLPLAQVMTINLEALSTGNQEEQARLFRACCDDGFFYLDFAASVAGLEASVDKTFELERRLFALPEQELLSYDIDRLSPKKLNGCAAKKLQLEAILSNIAKV